MIFLASIDSIKEKHNEFNWNDAETADLDDVEEIRDAKGRFARIKGSNYKETVDQLKFTHSIDYRVLMQNSRSVRHLENMVNWLFEKDADTCCVYP